MCYWSRGILELDEEGEEGYRGQGQVQKSLVGLILRVDVSFE